MDQNNQVYDLRSALNLLRSQPGQLVETDVPVDPSAELAGVYRHVGAGGTVPAAHPGRAGHALSSDQGPSRRSGRHRRPGQPEPGGPALLGRRPEELGHALRDCVSRPIPPVICAEAAPANR